MIKLAIGYIKVLYEILEYLKQDFLLLHVKYEDHGTGIRHEFNALEYEKYLRLMKMVSSLGKMLEPKPQTDRRQNGQRVFFDERDA